jgi:hypothetical protein
MSRIPFFEMLLLAWLGVASTTGCATVEVVPAEQLRGQKLAAASKPVAHIYADNWGIYLFKYIPLVTGNLNRSGGLRPPNLFTNTVRVDLLVETVAEEARRGGGTLLTDLRVRDRSLWLPWTLIFWLNEFEVSANSSIPEEPKRSPGPQPTE